MTKITALSIPKVTAVTHRPRSPPVAFENMTRFADVLGVQTCTSSQYIKWNKFDTRKKAQQEEETR